eukprot:CAMPEP_0203661174 /NCGR_PEP_ID=MMETSP0088-20131115/59463_1 /ASSEMBLY_ACC=CAM_ASM_001087 /TAXON_ID=426623 /ORGANISM="Chaetoceros affinis, Strain CCMP159" /LENGTH=199 /DNA_ID=CAMNT_0050523823 /DNA_START=13 /DNA_END=612 /DNA_ORIENTATION=+
MAVNTGAITSTVEDLLNYVLRTRLQRKAKSIIMSGIEFLAVDLAILFVSINLDKNVNIELGLFILAIIGAVYVFVLVTFIFIHAWCFTPDESIKMKPKEEVEEAFAGTNSQPPILDGFLELPFPAKFRGNGCAWWLPYLGWSISAAIIISGAVLYLIAEADMTPGSSAALAAASLLLYQISSDFAEYWVFSGNQVLEEE